MNHKKHSSVSYIVTAIGTASTFIELGCRTIARDPNGLLQLVNQKKPHRVYMLPPKSFDPSGVVLLHILRTLFRRGVSVANAVASSDAMQACEQWWQSKSLQATFYRTLFGTPLRKSK